MRLRNLFVALSALALLPASAQAEVKSYDLDVLIVLNTTTLTVTGFTRDVRTGEIVIADDSNASPTLMKYQQFVNISRTTRTDVFAGLNSFIHVRNLATSRTLPGQTGTGDTEGFVKWNPLSSWTPDGGPFCKGSNEIGNPLGANICPLAGTFSFEMTIAETVPSDSYDWAIWTFDAEGDLSSAAYLWSINSNGSSNLEYQIRGTLQTHVPALSAVGFAVLGASLMFLGARALRRRGDE